MAARLIPKSGGSPIVIDKPILLIGRQPNCDIVIQSSSKVSRRHCCFAQVNGKYLVRDLGSMNGVRVNGSRIDAECMLQSGDEVALGDVYFEFLSEVDGAGRRVPRQAEARSPASEHPTPDEQPQRKRGDEEYYLPLPESLAENHDVVHLEGRRDGLLIEPDEPSIRPKRDSDSHVDMAMRGH